MKNMILRVGFSWLVLMSTISAVHAQAMEKGNFSLSLGHGFVTPGTNILNTLENNSNFRSNKLGPYFASFQYMISDNFGLALNAAHWELNASFDEEPFNGISSETRFYCRNTSILIRGNGHVLRDEHFDVYFGIGVGARFGTWRLESEFNDEDLFTIVEPLNIPVGFSGTIGLNYMVVKNLGAYFEIGLAKSLLQLGLVAKI